MPQKMINLSKWQDFRGKNEGVLVYLNTATSTAMPVRDVLDELGKGFQSEPNYSTGTYNFIGNANSQLCNSTYKNRKRYLFFGTSYQGTSEESHGKYLIIGHMRIDKYMDARKRHMRNWMESKNEVSAPDCVDLKESLAFYSAEMQFYAPKDSFELTEAVMKGWGYKGRVAKHMKLTFDEDKNQELLDFFASKTPKTDEYITEVNKLEDEKQKLLAAALEAQDDDDDDW